MELAIAIGFSSRWTWRGLVCLALSGASPAMADEVPVSPEGATGARLEICPTTTKERSAQILVVAAPFVVRNAPGAQFGWFLHRHLAVDFTYIGTLFNAKAKAVPFNVHNKHAYWNQYTAGVRGFLSDSFYGGASLSELRSGDPDWVSIRRTSADLHIGNEMIDDGGFTFAIDWLGISLPLVTALHQSDAYKAENAASSTGNEADDLKRQLRLPFSYLFTLKFGYTFL